jgi:hypothetical protein
MLEENDDNYFNSMMSCLPKDFIGLPTADALIPTNPHHWGPFMLGSSVASDFSDLEMQFKQPFDNLMSAYDYLDTSPSNQIYDDRWRSVFIDTAIINSLCFEGGDLGAANAGAFANSRVDKYIDESNMEVSNRTIENELKVLKIRSQMSVNGTDVRMVRGIGAFKQNIRKEFRTNPLKNENFSRPVWSYKGFGGFRGGAIEASVFTAVPFSIKEIAFISFRFPQCKSILKRILGSCVSSLLCKSLSIYFLDRYLMYIY